ncbi:hypothetical protein D3C86_1309220 [compost metagenome]
MLDLLSGRQPLAHLGPQILPGDNPAQQLGVCLLEHWPVGIQPQGLALPARCLGRELHRRMGKPAGAHLDQGGVHCRQAKRLRRYLAPLDEHPRARKKRDPLRSGNPHTLSQLITTGAIGLNQRNRPLPKRSFLHLRGGKRTQPGRKDHLELLEQLAHNLGIPVGHGGGNRANWHGQDLARHAGQDLAQRFHGHQYPSWIS